MSSTKKNLLLVACVSALFVTAVYFIFIWSPDTNRWRRPELRCINNLRQIDGAKQQWAMENGNTNAVPTWEDIRPYLGRGAISNSIPTCYAKGTYTIGPLDKPPTCSIRQHTATFIKPEQ